MIRVALVISNSFRRRLQLSLMPVIHALPGNFARFPVFQSDWIYQNQTLNLRWIHQCIADPKSARSVKAGVKVGQCGGVKVSQWS